MNNKQEEEEEEEEENMTIFFIFKRDFSENPKKNRREIFWLHWTITQAPT